MCLTALLAVGPALAQEGPIDPDGTSKEEWRAKQQERRQRWENMSDEERAAARAEREAANAERRQKWESMSDEERQAARERRGSKGGRGMSDEQRQKMKERWDSMSDEERQAARDRMRQRKQRDQQ